MATGDKVAATRPLGQSNMRLDLVDYAAMALAAQYAVEAQIRALVTTPKATAGVATGERWSGSMTANPGSSTDGLFRLDSPVFIGVDANGGLVVKPNGTALSIAIPSGGTNQQVYAYVQDVSENTQVRRFLPATAPFNEFAQAINVALRQTVGLYVRAGSLGSVVPEDAVAGVTRPLLFLGIATNTGGVVTFTPATNTLETVRAPVSVPSTDSGTTTVKTTVTGSQSTVRELVNAALYAVGLAMFKGSDFVTPADGNNWGAYSTALLSGGIDKAYRQALGYVTVGNGTTVFGDFNTNAYANSKLLMDAVFASLPAQGGTVILKRGVTLTAWGGVTCNAPAGKHVEIVGDHSAVPSTTPQLSFAANESITASATGALVFRNLHIRWVQNGVIATTSPLKFFDCFIEKTAAADTGAFISGTNISDVTIERCSTSINLSAASANGMFYRASGTSRRLYVRKLDISIAGLDCSIFGFTDMRDNIVIEDVSISDTGSTLGFAGSGVFVCNSTDNATLAEIRGRRFRNIISSTQFVPTFFLGSAGNLDISKLTHLSATANAVAATAYSGAGKIFISDSKVSLISMVGAFPDVLMSRVDVMTSATIGSTTANQGVIVTDSCNFYGASVYALTVNAVFATRIRVSNNFFSGQGHATSAAFGCARITAGTLADAAHICHTIEIYGNTIENFQNTLWAGANVDCHMFEVNSSGCGKLVIARNIASNIMRSSSGAARFGAYLVEINSFDRATVGGQYMHISVTDNDIGETPQQLSIITDDACMLWKMLNISNCVRFTTVRNILNTVNNASGSGFPQTSHLLNFTNGATAAGGFRAGFVCSDNKVFFNGGAPNMTWDFVHLSWNNAGGNIDLIEFNNNTFSTWGAIVSFDGVNAFGFWASWLGGTVGYGSVLGNIVNEDSFANTNWFKINWTNAPSIQSIPSVWPASGAVFANNTQIKRN